MPSLRENIRNNARWADTFQGGTTDPALVQSHQADIEQETQAQIADAEANQLYLMKHDKNALNYAVKAQQMRLAQAKHDWDMQKAPDVLKRQQEMHNLSLRNEAAREAAAAAKAKLDADNEFRDNQKLEQSSMAHLELNNALHDPDIKTAEQRKAWVDSIPERYPYATTDSAFRERYDREASEIQKQIKSTQNVSFQGSPEEARAHFGKDASIRQTTKGVWTATIKGTPSTDDTKARTASLKEFQTETRALGVPFDALENPEQWKDAGNGKVFAKVKDEKGNLQDVTLPKARLDQLQERYKSLTAGNSAQPQATAAKTGFNPGATATKNGITYVRGEDGKWLPQ